MCDVIGHGSYSRKSEGTPYQALRTICLKRSGLGRSMFRPKAYSALLSLEETYMGVRLLADHLLLHVVPAPDHHC
jgi:hypothetical protein